MTCLDVGFSTLLFGVTTACGAAASAAIALGQSELYEQKIWVYERLSRPLLVRGGEGAAFDVTFHLSHH